MSKGIHVIMNGMWILM